MKEIKVMIIETGNDINYYDFVNCTIDRRFR